MNAFGLGGAITGPHAELAFALPFIALFAVCLVLVYAKWWRPLRQRERDRQYQQSVDKISTMLREAINRLYRQRVTDSDGYERWRTEVDAWYARVALTLDRAFGAAARREFEAAEASATIEAVHAFDPVHRRDLAELAARIECLRAILIRNRTRPAPGDLVKPRATQSAREADAAGPLRRPQHR